MIFLYYYDLSVLSGFLIFFFGRDCLVEDFSDNWVTIFGFAPSQIDLVLSYFIHYGQIIDKKHSSNGGNWIHVKYANRREVLSALSQNGKQISRNLMIGVIVRKEKVKIDFRICFNIM